MTGAANFAAACADSLFSAAALASFASHGFDLAHTLRISELPIGGRLRAAQDVWQIVTKNAWALGVVDQGYKVRWIDGCPHTPQ